MNDQLPPIPPVPPPPPTVTATIPAPVEATPAKRSRRKRAVAAVIVVAAVGVIAAAALTLTGGPSTEDRYLAAVAEAGVSRGSDALDVANANRICSELRAGAEPHGNELDALGVKHYCDEFASSFKVLERKTITGRFVLIDYKSADRGCVGAGGYSDINHSTRVVVRAPDGKELARTQLGSPSSSDVISCTWTFRLDLVEGEDRYILEVGDRGEISYTWKQITTPGAVAVSLG